MIQVQSQSKSVFSVIKIAASIFAGLVFALHSPGASAQGKLKRFSEFSDTQQISIDHSAWDKFLKTYIVELEDQRTIFKYADVTGGDKKSLENYLASLEGIDTKKLTKPQAYAYWVNFYNALTIKVVLDGYPVKSIKDLGLFKRGPWSKDFVKVSGAKLSLDNLEHGILRAFWSDPRTHYAVNCASYGCPNLQDTAFTAENTDALLTKGATEFINHPRGIDVSDKGKVKASSIYSWFQVDFGDSEEKVLEHVRLYASETLKERLSGKTKIDSYDYGWELNEK